MDLYVPSNVNLGALRHSDICRYSHYYYYIISLLYQIRNRDKRYKGKDFIPLNGKILKNVLGGGYKKFVNDLISIGIVETDNYYKPGVKSKGYRLHKKYRNVAHKKVQIHKRGFMEKITKSYKQNLDLPHLKYMENCVKSVTILSDVALDYVYDKTKSLGYFYEGDVSHLMAIDMLSNPENIYFKPDLIAGRIHTNITNLKRELRQFLRYDNQRLYEIDISNSQPFLFNILINKYIELYNKNINYLSYGPYKNTYYQEIDLYLTLTSQGLLYEYLMEKLSIKESREQFKTTFYKKVFYSRENPYYVHEERKQFRKLFPFISEIISYYKTPDYRNLAVTMQRIESDIMIGCVAKKLSEMNIYFLTIHDSILTTQENIQIVKDIILAEFWEKFSLRPTIKNK